MKSTRNIKTNQDGFSGVELVLVVLVVVLIAAAGYLVYRNHHTSNINKIVSVQGNSTKSSSNTISSSSTNGWKTYELTYEKLKFKYPSTWTVTNLNQGTGQYDNVWFRGPNLSVKILEEGNNICSPSGSSESVFPVLDSSTSFTFAGQPEYLSFYHNGITNASNKGEIIIVGVSADQTGYHCVPAKNDIMGSSSDIQAYLQFYSENGIGQTISYPMTALSSNQNYLDFKLLLQSMSY